MHLVAGAVPLFAGRFDDAVANFEAGLSVVEDAAQSHGATVDGRGAGTFGLGCFSFYGTKNITTGEGGMVTTQRDDYAARMKRMSLHGLSGDAWNRYTATGRWFYEIEEFGFKYNLTDVAAALGIGQLHRMEEFHQRRRRIAGMYTEALADLDACTTPYEAPGGTHAWHLYILQLMPVIFFDWSGWNYGFEFQTKFSCKRVCLSFFPLGILHFIDSFKRQDPN